MVNAGANPPPEGGSRLGGAAERIGAARYVLAAAALALFAATMFFSLPLRHAAAAALVLVLVAAIAPPPRSGVQPSDTGRASGQLWPDTAMKAAIEAMPKAAFVLDAGGTVRYANAEAGRLFPATRLGDLFTLTFRQPEFAESLELAGAGERIGESVTR